MIRRLTWVAVVALGAAACAADEPFVGEPELVASVVVSGLAQPTQMAIADDGSWFVAQLAGEENETTGQVLRIDPEDPGAARVVVLDGLDKPTGVAVFAGDLWVMERRRLIRTELDGTDRRVIVDDMAFNGRSEGALTVDGDRLLFDTSGRLSQRTAEPTTPADSSGVLWAVDGAGSVSAVATGFKHAYAHTRGPDGVLWTTELADGTYDGRPSVDEVVAVVEGDDHGWPRCVGDNRAVAEHGGSEAACAAVPRSQAVFDFGATPTGIAVAPWDTTRLLVALWVAGEVVAIPTDQALAPVEAVVVHADAERPQSLLADGDRVLLVDHGAGTIVALEPR